jgi:hypothetical protein
VAVGVVVGVAVGVAVGVPVSVGVTVAVDVGEGLAVAVGSAEVDAVQSSSGDWQSPRSSRNVPLALPSVRNWPVTLVARSVPSKWSPTIMMSAEGGQGNASCVPPSQGISVTVRFSTRSPVADTSKSMLPALVTLPE